MVVDDDNADIVVRVGAILGRHDVLADPSIHRLHGRRSDVIGDV